MNIPYLIAALNSLSVITELAPEAFALKQKLEAYARDPQASAYINNALQQNLVATPSVPR